MNQRAVQALQLKIVLLGEGCVGKTSLVLRYVENKFNDAHNTTLQASFLRKNLTIAGSRVTLNIWDTAGQERFHALGPIYYRDSNGAILVYDVTDPDSFNKVKTWVKELRKMLGNNVCIAIVGNKIDLLPPNEQNAIHINALCNEAIEYTKTIGNAEHYSTSAKASRGIDELFLSVTKRMLEWQEQQSPRPGSMVGGAGSNRTLRIADETEANANELDAQRSKCSC